MGQTDRGGWRAKDGDNMPKFYGFRKCTYCEIECTPGNFVDHQSERFCSACWVQHENPQHPDLEAIREKVKTAANTWKFTKKSIDEYKLPNGPHPVKN